MADQPAASTDIDVTRYPAERTRCEVWTRVMGYHRPVTAFNCGKQQEHRDRRPFVERGHGE